MWTAGNPQDQSLWVVCKYCPAAKGASQLFFVVFLYLNTFALPFGKHIKPSLRHVDAFYLVYCVGLDPNRIPFLWFRFLSFLSVVNRAEMKMARVVSTHSLPVPYCVLHYSCLQQFCPRDTGTMSALYLLCHGSIKNMPFLFCKLSLQFFRLVPI